MSWWFVYAFLFAIVSAMAPIMLLSTPQDPTLGTFTTPMIIAGVFGSLSVLCFFLGIFRSEAASVGYKRFVKWIGGS